MSYSSKFLKANKVSTPTLSDDEINALINSGYSLDDYYLDYVNFSLLHNPLRYFPYYTASNIDGKLFKHIGRKELFNGGSDSWKKDLRIPKETQLGRELYNATRSDFDKGHLTKREDVQWGENIEKAKEAAISTFFFTNAMPQVDRLNRGIWRKIEDYILHQEVIAQSRKITLFTGPIFQKHDPDFVTPVKGATIQLPYLFWKVIYYLKEGKLHRTAFLTSQLRLLQKKRIVKPIVRGEEELKKVEAFLNFKDAETYQIRVALIEKLGNLQFSDAEEVYQDDRPQQLILNNVNVRSEGGENIIEPDGINMTL